MYIFMTIHCQKKFLQTSLCTPPRVQNCGRTSVVMFSIYTTPTWYIIAVVSRICAKQRGDNSKSGVRGTDPKITEFIQSEAVKFKLN